jgi:replicative DNA helicase
MAEGYQLMNELPHNREAEEATIGAVLINPEVLVDLHFLSPDDFYIHRHQWIWEAFERLEEKREPIDLLTVTHELETVGRLAEIGGPAYLTSVLSQVPMSLNAEAYARMVEDQAIRRRVVQASAKATQAAYAAEQIEQVQEAANAVIDAVYRDSNDDNTFKDGLSKVYDRAQRNAELTAQGKPLEVGLTTGFLDLDRILLGIEDEESVIVGGRPGDGKTAFLLNIAAHAALVLGKRVAVFSQEMSSEEVARRLVSSYAEIDSQRIKTGALKDHEWAKFTNAIETLENSGLYVSDASSLTPAKLRAKCLQLKQAQGLDLVLVDYLQLMSAGVKTENRTREVGYISRHIKMLTRELKNPIISACQLSRASEQRSEKRPNLTDLRESGDIEQDANTVIFLYRPDKYGDTDKKNTTEIIVSKRRDGAVGTAELVYLAPVTKFVNAAAKTYQFNGG